MRHTVKPGTTFRRMTFYDRPALARTPGASSERPQRLKRRTLLSGKTRARLAKSREAGQA